MGFLDFLKSLFGGSKKPEPAEIHSGKAHPAKPVKPEPKPFELKVYAPCNGTLVAQKDIPDEGFSEGHMGSGYGIVPSDGDFKAFMDGELVVLYKTKHAYFIRDNASGISVMLHIGINTVEIDESKHAFSTDRKVGDQLKHGDDLCKANLQVIVEEGKSTTTPILIQSEGMEKRVILYNKNPGDTIAPGDVLLTVVDA